VRLVTEVDEILCRKTPMRVEKLDPPEPSRTTMECAKPNPRLVVCDDILTGAGWNFLI
jgi:hypothetical protein